MIQLRHTELCWDKMILLEAFDLLLYKHTELNHLYWNSDCDTVRSLIQMWSWCHHLTHQVMTSDRQRGSKVWPEARRRVTAALCSTQSFSDFVIYLFLSLFQWGGTTNWSLVRLWIWVFFFPSRWTSCFITTNSFRYHPFLPTRSSSSSRPSPLTLTFEDHAENFTQSPCTAVAAACTGSQYVAIIGPVVGAESKAINPFLLLFAPWLAVTGCSVIGQKHTCPLHFTLISLQLQTPTPARLRIPLLPPISTQCLFAALPLQPVNCPPSQCWANLWPRSGGVCVCGGGVSKWNSDCGLMFPQFSGPDLSVCN